MLEALHVRLEPSLVSGESGRADAGRLGVKDAIIPVDSGRRIHEAIKGSRLEIIAKCGHMPHEEKPDEFSHLLL